MPQAARSLVHRLTHRADNCAIVIGSKYSSASNEGIRAGCFNGPDVIDFYAAIDLKPDRRINGIDALPDCLNLLIGHG